MSLNIKIKKEERNVTKTICVNPNMTIRDAKKLLIGDISTHLKYNYQILYNDKTFSDYGIEDGDTVFSLHFYDGGGFGLCTIDVEKNNTRIIEHDHNAPTYRTIGDGLSVQAICEKDIFSKIK